MKVAFTIIADDEITPFLARVSQVVTDGSGNLFIARSLAAKVRDHLGKEAARRHKTADRLGATPTGHLTRAAESVDYGATKDAAEVTIASPGISRSFGDVEIVPVNGSKYLTIAARAESYGRRARSFDDLKFIPLKGGALPVLAKVTGEGKEKTMEVFYWLKKSVKIPQDRGLLPSDVELLQAAEDGAEDFLSFELAKRDG